MLVLGTIHKRKVVILIDSGSTHYFLSERVLRELGIDQSHSIKAGVASGQKLRTGGTCLQVPLQMLQYMFSVDFHVIPLNDYDVVLGTVWLQEIGPVLWDFRTRQLSFT